MALDVYFRDDIGHVLVALAASSTETTGEYERGYRAALAHVGLAFGLIDAREAGNDRGNGGLYRGAIARDRLRSRADPCVPRAGRQGDLQTT